MADTLQLEEVPKRAPQSKFSHEELDSMLTMLAVAKEEGHSFRTALWPSIAASFEDPLKNVPRICESRYSRLRRQYRQVKFLRETSGFDWDDVNCVPTATDEVWAEIKKTHPDKMIWRTTKFPWFDRVLFIEGDSLATGRYRRHGVEIDDNINDISQTGPTLRPLLAASTTLSLSNTNLTVEKRHRESSPPEIGPNKKQKPSIFGALEKIGEGLQLIASGFSKDKRDTVDSTLPGQAQLKVQDESYLTEEGQIVMLELLSDSTLARTYVAIKHENLRVQWIKKQLEKYSQKEDRDVEEFLIGEVFAEEEEGVFN